MEFKKYFLTTTKKKTESLIAELSNYKIENFEILECQNFLKEIKEVIAKDKNEYALFVNEDTIIPWNIDQRVRECINKANGEFGQENWAIIGNKGIDYLSKEKVNYINEPETRSIPTGSNYPHTAQYLDSNIFLLNLKSIRKTKVVLDSFSENYFIAQYLLLEFTKEGLISGIDSTLYTRTHKQFKFNKTNTREISKIFHKHFINSTIRTIEGDIRIPETNFNYLEPVKKDKREDINLVILQNLERAYINKEVRINIVVRTTLRHLGQIRRLLDTIRIGQGNINSKLKVRVFFGINNTNRNDWEEVVEVLKKDYGEIDLRAVKEEDFGLRKNRVGIISEVINKIEDEKNEYVWVVDDDDFVMIDVFRYGNIILNEEAVVVGDSVVFSEEWEDDENITYPKKSSYKLRYYASSYFSTLLGDNVIPVCSTIYPVKVLKKIFNEFELLGDYSEDYSIFLLSMKFAGIRATKYLFAGISHHGHNTVSESKQTNWDYSYATFFSEISNKKVFPRFITDYVRNCKSFKQNDEIQFEIFERELVYYAWIVLKKFNIKKKHIQPIINSLAVASKGIKNFSGTFKRKAS